MVFYVAAKYFNFEEKNLKCQYLHCIYFAITSNTLIYDFVYTFIMLRLNLQKKKTKRRDSGSKRNPM